MLALLLVMYELFKVLTEGDRVLAAVGAGLVVFAPVVQWWGAVNALAEMLIFGALFVVCLDRFLAGRTLRARLAPTLGMAYAGVAYAMTLYPAAMVPLGYVFAALALGVVIRRAHAFRLDARTALFAAGVLALAAGCLAWYLVKSG